MYIVSSIKSKLTFSMNILFIKSSAIPYRSLEWIPGLPIAIDDQDAAKPIIWSYHDSTLYSNKDID